MQLYEIQYSVFYKGSYSDPYTLRLRVDRSEIRDRVNEVARDKHKTQLAMILSIEVVAEK